MLSLNLYSIHSFSKVVGHVRSHKRINPTQFFLFLFHFILVQSNSLTGLNNCMEQVNNVNIELVLHNSQVQNLPYPEWIWYMAESTCPVQVIDKSWKSYTCKWVWIVPNMDSGRPKPVITSMRTHSHNTIIYNTWFITRTNG